MLPDNYENEPSPLSKTNPFAFLLTKFAVKSKKQAKINFDLRSQLHTYG